MAKVSKKNSARMADLESLYWEAQGSFLDGFVEVYGGLRSDAVRYLIDDLIGHYASLRKDGM